MLMSLASTGRLAAATVAVVVSTSFAPAIAGDFTGAGATFPAPAYSAWASEYKTKTGNGLNYQAIGSGGGLTQILNRTVDFGASDAPVADAKLADGKLLQFPAVIGSVVPIVNLDGVASNQLKLDGKLLGDIYLGKVTKWNDPAIAALNKDLKLPDLAILPAYRSDGSGTTFVFTSYLADVSPEWKDTVGAATSVKWPTGNGAKGNDGVSATVKNVKGAIGYVEYVYAAANGLVTAQLGNKAGKFVSPSVEAFQAAAANADWKGAKNFAASMINTGGDTTWPIVSATFILLPTNPADAAKSADVMKFFDWSFANGDKLASDLHYIPLPGSVKDAVRAAWTSEIKDASGAAIYKK